MNQKTGTVVSVVALVGTVAGAGYYAYKYRPEIQQVSLVGCDAEGGSRAHCAPPDAHILCMQTLTAKASQAYTTAAETLSSLRLRLGGKATAAAE